MNRVLDNGVRILSSGLKHRQHRPKLRERRLRELRLVAACARWRSDAFEHGHYGAGSVGHG